MDTSVLLSILLVLSYFWAVFSVFQYGITGNEFFGVADDTVAGSGEIVRAEAVKVSTETANSVT
ncbi:hypothetical protein P5E82_15055, partial [Clostridium perfringens]|nr:hypothetical protein [Clostridium perfringens]